MNVNRALISLLAAASLLSADTLVLRNGSTINGRFVSGDNRALRFAVGSQVNTYDLVDVDSLRFSDYPSPQTSYNGPPSTPSNPPPPPVSRPPDAYAAPGTAPIGNGPGGIQIPAGTQISVRMIDAADSEKDYVGKTYRATVDKAVIINGQTAIPRDADTVVVLANSKESGKIEGRTTLSLNLKSISFNGRTYDISSSAVEKESSSRTKRSGEVIGGTAVLGAIIGAVAGGGRGAAIGAGSGAAVGTAAQVATSGQRVKVPSETELIFTLQNSLNL